MRKILLAVCIATLISCGKDEPSLTDADAVINDWLTTNNITNATMDESGIYYYPIVENAAGTQVATESVVSIYYTLSDLNGNTIASHQRSNGDSLLLKAGVSAVYPVGLDVGLGFMRVGETYGIIIPPTTLGYNQLTSGAIDPNLISHFVVEVTGVQLETAIYALELTAINNYIMAENLNDTVTNPLNRVQQFVSGLSYKRISKGFGPLPVNGETIVVNYSGAFLDKSVFDTQTNFQYTIGTNVPRPLAPGFEFGITLMQPNERSLVIVPSSQAYRESARVIPASIINDLINDFVIPDYVASIPPYTTLVFDITRFD